MNDPINRAEVAKILGCCKDNVTKALKEGNLPPSSPKVPGGVHLFWEREDIIRLSKLCPKTMDEFNRTMKL